MLNRRWRRDQVEGFFEALPGCRVAMETWPGAHYWGRLLSAMEHEVKLIPAQFVRPFVKSNRNDAVDAEAICKAAQRPGMRFGVARGEWAQAVLALHRGRRLLIKQRTQVINALRGQCAELAVIAPRNRAGVAQLLAVVADAEDDHLSAQARAALCTFVEMLEQMGARIARLERELRHWHRNGEVSRRLQAIPGIGVLAATALAASRGNGVQFCNSRQFSASLGLVTRQNGDG